MTKNNRFGFAIFLAAATLSLSSLTAAAAPLTMELTGRTSQPIGHYDFCKEYPRECQPLAGGDAGPAHLTPEMWKTVLDVNYTVNTTVRPETDLQQYGVEEKWEYPTSGAGDCEDYALMKRKLLIQKGIPTSDLLMTVVLQPNGEGHAVLTFRTDRGDFILDNMRNKVMLWSETEYTYLKRQDAANPGAWVKIEDGRAAYVASIHN
ncbi:transglutaminase-like cysteine peptidase [Allorhizobium sp. BGMRC 0089]|uniref:transglutaminase-like cysteine peptidase n=1 Tax=Allorhizobium sonneratiae TaxID=2934936 RepID=UPI0020346558|nr:transglutaminase-like cysteine peptidase [Allorhizobium sonneratiae]MCM2293723.1 transglutaminase-like cysteine peptidase [Allorhizobium sonneratiae]